MTEHINKAADIEKLADTFIGEWCGTDAAYLIDTDDNPGQRLREDIQALITHREREARLDELEKCYQKFGMPKQLRTNLPTDFTRYQMCRIGELKKGEI